MAFLPVFALEAQAGMLFRPLAYTKTFAILFSAFLAITLTPALMTLFIHGKIRSEEKNPLSLFLGLYEPVVNSLSIQNGNHPFAIVLVAITLIPSEDGGVSCHLARVPLHACDCPALHLRDIEGPPDPGQDPDDHS
jgi:Cu/Ag efflux pump CusA